MNNQNEEHVDLSIVANTISEADINVEKYKGKKENTGLANWVINKRKKDIEYKIKAVKQLILEEVRKANGKGWEGIDINTYLTLSKAYYSINEELKKYGLREDMFMGLLEEMINTCSRVIIVEKKTKEIKNHLSKMKDIIERM